MKCKIHHVEMVCLKCLTSAAGKIGGKARTEKKITAARQNAEKAHSARRQSKKTPKAAPLDRSKIWTRNDTLSYFREHPQSKVTVTTLVEAAPRLKKDSAKIYAGQHLFLFAKNGTITKLERGVYCLTA